MHFLKLSLMVVLRKGGKNLSIIQKLNTLFSQLFCEYYKSRRMFDSCVLMYVHEIAPLNVCFSNEQSNVLGFKQFDLNSFETIEC